MLAILSPLLGFLSPFVADILKLFQSKLDYAHELAMRDKDIEAARVSGQFTFDTAVAKGDVDDVISAREAAPPSYGTRLLDALDDETGWFARLVKLWLIWSLALVEIANGFIRPWMAYYTFLLYGAVKVARAYLYVVATSGGGQVPPDLVAQAIVGMWSDHDWLLMEYIAGFFLGARHRLKSAQNPPQM